MFNAIRRFPILVGLLLLSLAAGSAGADDWALDAAHSSVGFSVKHMAISKTRGTFDDFTAEVTFDPAKPESWTCTATIQAASINTADKKRDDHLRNEDFFDVAKYPTLVFKSTGAKMKDKNHGTLSGDLTMHGVTRAIDLDLEFLGSITDPWGNTRAGFTAETKIDRKDWGLTWNKTLDAGGLVVGNDVTITLEIELIKQ